MGFIVLDVPGAILCFEQVSGSQHLCCLRVVTFPIILSVENPTVYEQSVGAGMRHATHPVICIETSGMAARRGLAAEFN